MRQASTTWARLAVVLRPLTSVPTTERGHEGWSLRLAGDALSALRPEDEQEITDTYESALAIADELGMAPLRAHCHLGLGRLARRARRSADAEGHCAIAQALFEAMGMTRWLERDGRR
jgi:hypothetical protein